MKTVQRASAWFTIVICVQLPLAALAQDATITSVPAVAQVANDSSNPLSAALQSVPGLLAQIDSAVTTAVENTVAALTKILNPEAVYSYGRSPPVYPSRKDLLHIMLGSAKS